MLAAILMTVLVLGGSFRFTFRFTWRQRRPEAPHERDLRRSGTRIWTSTTLAAPPGIPMRERIRRARAVCVAGLTLIVAGCAHAPGKDGVPVDCPEGTEGQLERFNDQVKYAHCLLPDGSRHGPFGIYIDGRRRTAGRFEQGQPHGVWMGYYDDGSKAWRVQFEGGVVHGPAASWYPGVTKRTAWHFNRGNRTGDFTRWAADGTLIRKGEVRSISTGAAEDAKPGGEKPSSESAVGHFCAEDVIRQQVGAAVPLISSCAPWDRQFWVTFPRHTRAAFYIEREGFVVDAQVVFRESRVESFETCIELVLDALEFENTGEGVCIVQYPFIFGEEPPPKPQDAAAPLP